MRIVLNLKEGFYHAVSIKKKVIFPILIPPNILGGISVVGGVLGGINAGLWDVD